MRTIEVPDRLLSGRLVLQDNECYTPDDEEIIKMSLGNSSIYVKAVRKHRSSCKCCVFRNKFCAAIPLNCKHHYFIDLDSILEDL